jgi:hypothetical protein
MITIVSGLPRSGTSLMMQMLAAGGMSILTDHLRAPDEDNPQGYLEWEPVKRLLQEPERIAEAEGMVVKVVSPLLSSLPAQHSYRVIFMLRSEEEMLSSQAEMIRRAATESGRSDAELKQAYEKHRQQILSWLEQQPHFRTLRVWFPDVIRDPRTQAERVRQFLDFDVDVEAMVRQVIPSLYRQRS